MTIKGYPYFSAAVPTTKAGTENQYGGGLVRLYVMRGATAIIAEMAHNDVANQPSSSLTTLKTTMKAYWASLRSGVPTCRRLVRR